MRQEMRCTMKVKFLLNIIAEMKKIIYTPSITAMLNNTSSLRGSLRCHAESIIAVNNAMDEKQLMAMDTFDAFMAP